MFLFGANDFIFVCIYMLWSLKFLYLLFCLPFGLFSDIMCVSFGFTFIFFLLRLSVFVRMDFLS